MTDEFGAAVRSYRTRPNQREGTCDPDRCREGAHRRGELPRRARLPGVVRARAARLGRAWAHSAPVITRTLAQPGIYVPGVTAADSQLLSRLTDRFSALRQSAPVLKSLTTMCVNVRHGELASMRHRIGQSTLIHARNPVQPATVA
jgi:hypothetical protein